MSLACIGGHVGSSMIGYLTLPWVMTSELYPLRFRGPLGGITTSMVQLISFATIKMYPDLRASVGIEWIMWIFSGAALLGALFALTVLPETRGRSLDQIESAFSGKSKSDTSVHTLPSISVQPKNNITLQKFVSISEEKYPNMVANAYAYDNFSLELSPDDKVNINEPDRNRDVARVISFEHVYF